MNIAGEGGLSDQFLQRERERTDRKKGVADWPSLLIARDKGEEREKKIGWRSPSYNCCILLLKKEGSSFHCRVGTREEASRISVVARSPDQGPNQSKKIPRGDLLELSVVSCYIVRNC